jgi:hypothetical protein
MKTFGFLIFFSLVGLYLSAQNIVVADTMIKFGITEKGKADGEISEIKIGKEGGSIQSSDGKVELIFPSGALTKKTTISIQPIINFAPNGGNHAYRMEPSGVSFQQPVQIVFHYKDEDTEGSFADLMGIAMQDDKGLWAPLENLELDTVLKTLTASIRHFSSYVNYAWSKLYPSSAKVKVNGSLRLQIRTLTPLDDNDDEVTSLGGVETPPAESWSVNSILHGNSRVGLISASQKNSAIYHAPASIPQQNPVAVSVEHIYKGKGLNQKIMRLVSNITIYDDAYEVKMVAAIVGGSPAAWGGVVTYRDEGSFVVSLQKDKPAVVNIKNQMEVMTNNCSKIILNPNSNTGLLHVAGTREIKITPANPPTQPYPIIEIWFVPHPIELTQFRFTCPPPPGVKQSVSGSIDLSKAPMMLFMGRPAIPQYIKFVAKDEEQTILESPAGVKEIYYKISVKKITE